MYFYIFFIFSTFVLTFSFFDIELLSCIRNESFKLKRLRIHTMMNKVRRGMYCCTPPRMCVGGKSDDHVQETNSRCREERPSVAPGSGVDVVQGLSRMKPIQTRCNTRNQIVSSCCCVLMVAMLLLPPLCLLFFFVLHAISMIVALANFNSDACSRFLITNCGVIFRSGLALLRIPVPLRWPKSRQNLVNSRANLGWPWEAKK